jgi:membrane protease YdiL (CAAX protease family)
MQTTSGSPDLMDPGPHSTAQEARAWRLFAGYCIVTFAWTWMIWWGGVIASTYAVGIPLGFLVFLGGVGPFLGTLFVLRRFGRTYQKGFLRRFWDPRRVTAFWWLAMVVVAIFPALAAYLVIVAAGSPPAAEATLTLGAVTFAVGFALAAGAVEEPGWRGVSRDLLQSRVKPALGAVMLGALWALWHLPLFFMEGTYQHALGFLTARFWFFNLSLALLSFLYVWLCNGSNGSILIAVLAHAGTNIAGSLIPQDAVTDMIRSLVLLFAVIAVLWLTRGNLHHHQGSGRAGLHDKPVTISVARRTKRQRMVTVVGVVASLLIFPVLAMQALRVADQRAAKEAWTELRAAAERPVDVFDPAMVEGLPEAARRYFLYTIAPGTPLHPVSEISMGGEIGLGDRGAPGYQPMRAREILAPPHGFVWRLEAAGSGAIRMSGSDAMAGERSWTRFWLHRTLPVAREGGDFNHLRSSFGRLVAEAGFWAPAALLPRNGVRWEESDAPDQARAVVTHGALAQALEIAVAEDGQPQWVMIQRWSNANPEGEWRVQPFGGTLDDFRTFGGFTLPTRVDGGNHFGTEDYFPFFRARVEDVRFPAP